MIIDYTFANDILEQIEGELNLLGDRNLIKVQNTSISKLKPNFEWLRKTQYYSLPVSSNGATQIIQITKEYYEILTSDWKEKHPTLVKNGLENTIKTLMFEDLPEEAIHTAIYEKVSNLVYSYNQVLETTKESNGIFGIEEEEKILLIHLNRYHDIINSDTEQIDFLRGITLNKKISDLVLEIYIRFINMRLRMLNPAPPQTKIQRDDKLTKILWNGSQRDLLELFIELQNKGWIDEFKYGEIKKKADSILNLFDLTLTKKNDNSNLQNSFYQILKGINNPETKKREYDEILGTKKDRRFSKIEEKRDSIVGN